MNFSLFYHHKKVDSRPLKRMYFNQYICIIKNFFYLFISLLLGDTKSPLLYQFHFFNIVYKAFMVPQKHDLSLMSLFPIVQHGIQSLFQNCVGLIDSLSPKDLLLCHPSFQIGVYCSRRFLDVFFNKHKVGITRHQSIQLSTHPHAHLLSHSSLNSDQCVQ